VVPNFASDLSFQRVDRSSPALALIPDESRERIGRVRMANLDTASSRDTSLDRRRLAAGAKFRRRAGVAYHAKESDSVAFDFFFAGNLASFVERWLCLALSF
jgi:hypothetical protein